ncbi:unnamed protein product, partial [Closterium sp. NIES-53]
LIGNNRCISSRFDILPASLPFPQPLPQPLPLGLPPTVPPTLPLPLPLWLVLHPPPVMQEIERDGSLGGRGDSCGIYQPACVAQGGKVGWRETKSRRAGEVEQSS